jgi:hypothetical protein
MAHMLDQQFADFKHVIVVSPILRNLRVKVVAVHARRVDDSGHAYQRGEL